MDTIFTKNNPLEEILAEFTEAARLTSAKDMLTKAQVLHELRMYCILKYGTLKAASKEIGISQNYLSAMLNGQENPSVQVRALLNLKKIEMYVRVPAISADKNERLPKSPNGTRAPIKPRVR